MLTADQFPARFRHEAGRFPAFCGDADGQHAEKHEEEIEDAEDDEGFRHTDRSRAFKEVHQHHRQRGGQHRAAAEAHNRQARGHARFVGKPFHQRGHGADIAQSQPHAAEYAVAQIQQPQVVLLNAQRGDEEAQPEADGGNEHRFARADALHPSAEHRGRCAQHRQCDAEYPAHGGQRPVAGCGFGNAEDFRQRGVENGIGVNLPDGKVDRQRGGRHQPAVEVGRRYGVCFI